MYRVIAGSLVAVTLAACPSMPVVCETGDEPVCDGGALPDDVCNTQDEASSDPDCQLTLGMVKEGYISTLADGGYDKDWYTVTLPTLSPGNLLSVQAGYDPLRVPQTAVNFSVNLISETGTSLRVGADRRAGGAAPKLVSFIIPFHESNARLFVLVGDEGTTPAPRVDNRNSYTIKVDVAPNPDSNEPANDTVATNVPLTDSGGIRASPTGMTAIGGYLATENDVDLFSFDVTGSTRQLIYVRIVGPTTQPSPPPPYQLSYVLKDPAGVAIAEGNMANNTLPIDLATSRLSRGAGKYTVEVKGYKSPNMPTAVIGGDLRVKYTLDVRVMPDLDMQEPNDSQMAAKVIELNPGQSETVTGRIATVPDEEWFLLRLKSANAPTVLRYKVTPTMTGGRFPALSAAPERELRLMKAVTGGANDADNRATCIRNSPICPKWYTEDDSKQLLVEAVCNTSTPPMCLWSDRVETQRFANLKNMEGAISVPAHAGDTDYYAFYSDPGKGALKWADDRDYTIRFWVENDADEAGRQGGPTPGTISSSASTLSGRLTFGHGRLLDNFDVNTGSSLRGPNDYDAVPTDVDTFQINYSGAAADQSWSLEWELDTVDGGSPPGEVALDFNFCSSTASLPDGGCAGRSLTLGYSDGARAPWYAQTFQNATQLMRIVRSPNNHRITLLPVACACFSASNVTAGRYFLSVAGVNRTSQEPIAYRIIQSSGTYPQSYTSADGGGGMCPSGVDAGCRFTGP